jgi:SAM-dependent methyltransferase
MIAELKDSLVKYARKYTSIETRRRIIRITRWPPIGWVNFGSFKRLRPISSEWGAERGNPIDRYYIEKYLAECSRLIRGRVLEIGDDTYTRKFASPQLEQSDVLHVSENKPNVTIIGDLTSANHIPADSFDCIILTQTLQFIYDVPAVIRTVYRILKPGGCALVTVPGISQISRYDMDRWGDYWRFTTKSIFKLFEVHFPSENITVKAFGNVKASVAFLHGIAYEELRKNELDYFDPDYELLITVKATKPEYTDANSRT